MKFNVLLLSALLLPCLALAGNKSKPNPASKKFKVHQCEGAAKVRAKALLDFYDGGLNSGRSSVEDKVELKSPISAPNKKSKYDVLEVSGHIYKADYRLRMIYAQNQLPDCLLMGEEILNLSNL